MTKWNITKQELVEKAQELHDDIVIFLSEANNNQITLGQRVELKGVVYELEKLNYIFTEEEIKNEQ